jgi:hypothetical protein
VNSILNTTKQTHTFFDNQSHHTDRACHSEYYTKNIKFSNIIKQTANRIYKEQVLPAKQ